jgi:hypothetical protein
MIFWLGWLSLPHVELPQWHLEAKLLPPVPLWITLGTGNLEAATSLFPVPNEVQYMSST